MKRWFSVSFIQTVLSLGARSPKALIIEILISFAPFVALSLFAWWLVSRQRVDSWVRFLLFSLASGIFLIIGSFQGIPLKGYEDPISSLIAGFIVAAIAAVGIAWRLRAIIKSGT